MKILFAVAACILCISTAAQEIVTSTKQTLTPTHAAFRAYLQFGLAFESERKPNTLFAFEYAISPEKGRRYFVGLGMDVARREVTDRNYSYNDNTGTLRNNVKLYSLHFSQRYIFNPRDKISLFLGFNLGLRTLSQDVSFKYTSFFPIFPFPLPVRENIYGEKRHTMNMTGNLGLLFKFNDVAGLTSSIGIRSSNEIEMYEGHRKGICPVFTIGFVAGRLGKTKVRKSPPPTAEKKSQPKQEDEGDGFK